MGIKTLKSKKPTLIVGLKYGVPKGIRTPVAAVKGQCPRPLDDGDNVFCPKLLFGGARRDRTADLYTASVALSQLSYSPVKMTANLNKAATVRESLNAVKIYCDFQ